MRSNYLDIINELGEQSQYMLPINPMSTLFQLQEQ